jgi:hypothetical protein
MDLEPKIFPVHSEEELKAQAAEFEKSGRRVIECSDFEHGIMGKLAYLMPSEGKSLENGWSAEDADAIWIKWLIFGKELQSERLQVTDGTKLFELFSQHKDHGVCGFANPMDLTSGFICLCKAKEEGKSLVFFVHLRDAKGIPPELLKYMEPAAHVVKPEV